MTLGGGVIFKIASKTTVRDLGGFVWRELGSCLVESRCGAVV
jgi:hypothetical protein